MKKNVSSIRKTRNFQRLSLISNFISILSILLIVITTNCSLFTGDGKSVKITSFFPIDEVEQTTNFTITFSNEIVNDSLLNVWLEKAPVNFDPKIPGKFQWIAKDKIRFYPDAMLLPSSKYTAVFLSSSISQYGYSLKGDSRFKFHTKRFRVNSGSLSFHFDPNQENTAKLLATIEFNYPVDPQEAIKKISIKHKNGSNIPFKLLTTSPQEIITLESENIQRDESGKEIQLKISAGLLPVHGNLGLEENYVKPATLPQQQHLKVERVFPVRESPKRRHVRIQFNMPVDANRASQFVNINPALQHKITATHHYLDLKGSFKIGETYHVSVRKGFRAVDGSLLEKDFKTTISFRKENIPPQIDFVGEGFYLTRSGHLNLGIATINMDQIAIEIDKIYANNLVHLLNENDPGSKYGYFWYNINSMGKRVHQEEKTVQKIPNEEVVTPVNFADLLKNQPHGIFNITARDSRERWVQSSKWVMATDMGLVAKRAGDDLWIWVNSLTSLNPVANAEVKLFSQNNQILFKAQTNNDGLAIFQNLKDIETEFTPYLITASAGEDLCFLELQRRKIATADFDVNGQTYLEHGYEAYLYCERDIYRPGETVNLAGIVRGENNTVPAPFPVIFRVKGPEDKILTEQRAKLNGQGAVELNVKIPEYAKTGVYLATLSISEKNEIGRADFNIEEFIPDRMKVKLFTDEENYFSGEQMKVNVEAVTLFGPPASGRQVEADIEIEGTVFSPPKWTSFTFKNDKKSFSKQRFDLGNQTLDQNGKYLYLYSIPEKLEAPSALRGIISTTVLEPGGRSVSAYRSVAIHPYSSYIGLRMAKQGYAEPHKDTEIEFVVMTPNTELLGDQQLEVSLYRVYWHSILKRITSTGRYRYVSEKVEDLVNQFQITSSLEKSSFKVKPEEYGKYLVVVRDIDTNSSSSISFYASGWGYSPWAMDNPDRVELDLDKESYLPGETAKLQIRAPFTGKLLLTTEREKIFNYKVINLTENTATIDLPVSENYKPNVYVSAFLIRSTASLEKDTPVRAFGVTPLMINNKDNRLNVEIKTPDEIRPNKELTIQVTTNKSGGSRPYITIAAVDEGICQLTDFQSPDAHTFFFGKKRLAVETSDIYSMILPEIESTPSSASGGFVEARRKKHISPGGVTRVKPVAFWSGLIKTNRRGEGKVKFKIPQFNGTLRLMAVAFSDDLFGDFEKKIFVREPIVMTPTFPRFLASGDVFTVPVSIFNGTGSAGNFDLKLKTKGPVELTGESIKKVKIEPQKETVVYFQLKADKSVGKLKFILSCKGNGEKSEMSVDVPLRAPVPFTTLSNSGSVTENKPASFTFPKDWLANTGEFSLSISAFPAIQFTRSLQYLLSYPHGCIEQTTSKLFPLLYFKDLAKIIEPELFEVNSADYFIEEGINKIENLQLPSGAFSYWPEGDYINNWSSIYAAHFLVEARKNGYVVSDRVYNKMIEALKKYSRDYRSDDSISLQTAVYSCYVLSMANKSPKSTMLYLKNNILDKLSDFSQYQLAGAFAYSGDWQTARMLIPKVVISFDPGEKRESGRNFNSPIRARAIMLDVLSEIDETNPAIPKLVETLTKAASENNRWYTTQENAFAFLALGKILKKQSRGKFTGTLTIEGDLYKKFDMSDVQFSDKSWAGKKVNISIEGEGTCYYSYRAEGIPSKMHIDEFDHDLIVRRHYLNEQGIPINYSSFQQGDLVIAKISIKAPNESLENVAVIDMLPAGFEIENPRLQSRKSIDWIGDNNYYPTYLDIRDDRLILFGDFQRGRDETFYYGLRAVTKGKFILPPIRGEAMYAPEKSSVASGGEIVIK